MKLYFAITLSLVAATFGAIQQPEAAQIQHIQQDENEAAYTHAPIIEDIIPYARIASADAEPKAYDPCYCLPPNPSGCGSLCASYGYNGGLCISYSCYCLLY